MRAFTSLPPTCWCEGVYQFLRRRMSQGLKKVMARRLQVPFTAPQDCRTRPLLLVLRMSYGNHMLVPPLR